MGAFLDKAGNRHIFATDDEKAVASILSRYCIEPIDFGLVEVIRARSGFFLRCRNEGSYFLIENRDPQKLIQRARDRAMEIELGKSVGLPRGRCFSAAR